jgi:hypothetical protein
LLWHWQPARALKALLVRKAPRALLVPKVLLVLKVLPAPKALPAPKVPLALLVKAAP